MKSYTTYLWENPSNHRYYTATLTRDLFGCWVVTRVNGGKRKSGVTHNTVCQSEQDGIALLESIHKTRISPSHGYELSISNLETTPENRQEGTLEAQEGGYIDNELQR